MYAETFPGTDIEHFDDPPSDPIGLLQQWLPPTGDDDPTRSIMALATVGIDGYPNIRHVLASDVSSQGISFHVSSNSTKVEELEATPKAAVSMVWPSEGKQLIVQGDVHVQPTAEAEKVYHQRSRYLQLLAHINSDSVAKMPSQDRKELWSQFLRDNPGQTRPPATWLGFVLVPTRISFWRAVPDTPSNRHDYKLKDGNWKLEVVAG